MFHFYKKVFGLSIELTVSRRKKKNRDEVFLTYLSRMISGMEKNTYLYKENEAQKSKVKSDIKRI